MKYLHTHKKAFSIVLAMGVVLSVSLTTIYLLEYVMPYSRDTKGIEFSSNAYYQGSAAVEQWLLFVAQNDLWDETEKEYEDWWTWLVYEIEARGDTIPPAWEGNSEYDPDWNMLAPGKPLQIEIWEWDWDDGNILFRLPDTWIGPWYYLKDMPGGVVTWQLSADEITLSSLGTFATAWSDNTDFKTGYERPFSIEWKSWVVLEWPEQWTTLRFNTFYDRNCKTEQKKCTLKLSIVNRLILDDQKNTPIPFLEYKITNAGNTPLRYTRIKANGFSNWFKKNIDIKVPQQTVNEAFDFTVFQ